jgi:cysteinyl-tRNA synthetase
MHEIYLTNTLTKTKEIFTPITPGSVSMYHCGPTVYGLIHIGNLRAFLLGDIVRRVFEYNGYETKQVMNITDIGHLVSDGDDGDDKMTKGLRNEGMEITLDNMLKLARKYEDIFVNDITEMNILKPKILPRASEHIDEDIEIIKNLEEKGYTYTTSDGIYFDTEKMPDYGKLGGLSNSHESRIGEISEKKNPRDFALWKFDETKGWQSPWGQGFPGWHIECSGMGMKYLGAQFDIHTGGHDLASVHHNNEIAQSECSTGHAPFVNYWLHNEFVNIGDTKMAKSGDNSITMESLRTNGHNPMALRYLYLQSHYRSQISFSWDSLSGSETALKKLQNYIANISEVGEINESYQVLFRDMINDDLNTAGGLAIVWELMKNPDVSDADKKATILDFDQVLGLKLSEVVADVDVEIPAHIQKLLADRAIAREHQDWHTSDLIRDEIQAMGYILKDTDDGQKVRKV